MFRKKNQYIPEEQRIIYWIADQCELYLKYNIVNLSKADLHHYILRDIVASLEINGKIKTILKQNIRWENYIQKMFGKEKIDTIRLLR